MNRSVERQPTKAHCVLCDVVCVKKVTTRCRKGHSHILCDICFRNVSVDNSVLCFTDPFNKPHYCVGYYNGKWNKLTSPFGRAFMSHSADSIPPVAKGDAVLSARPKGNMNARPKGDKCIRSASCPPSTSLSAAAKEYIPQYEKLKQELGFAKCMNCNTFDITIANKPCAHLTFCGSCAEQKNICPQCQTYIFL